MKKTETWYFSVTDIIFALTDERELRGVKEGLEFAILTDEITKAWRCGTGNLA